MSEIKIVLENDDFSSFIDGDGVIKISVGKDGFDDDEKLLSRILINLHFQLRNIITKNLPPTVKKQVLGREDAIKENSKEISQGFVFKENKTCKCDGLWEELLSMLYIVQKETDRLPGPEKYSGAYYSAGNGWVCPQRGYDKQKIRRSYEEFKEENFERSEEGEDLHHKGFKCKKCGKIFQLEAEWQ